MEDVEDRIIESLDTNIGRYFLFYSAVHADDAELTFSSVLENIGIDNDCTMKNKTKVLLLSDKTAGFHPLVGPIFVTRVMGKQIMWVPSVCLFPIDD